MFFTRFLFPFSLTIWHIYGTGLFVISLFVFLTLNYNNVMALFEGEAVGIFNALGIRAPLSNRRGAGG